MSSTPTPKVKVATVWLDGCSGCHMSFLDLDERLLVLAQKIDLVCSPVVDPKEFPASVDVTIVEGAVSSDHDLHKALLIRERSKVLIALGDCAVTGNVPAMRNPYQREELFERAYVENATYPATEELRRLKLPVIGVPALLEKARPIHEIVKVDVFIPGCPPPADAIFYVLTQLLEGKVPNISEVTRFGK